MLPEHSILLASASVVTLPHVMPPGQRTSQRVAAQYTFGQAFPPLHSMSQVPASQTTPPKQPFGPHVTVQDEPPQYTGEFMHELPPVQSMLQDVA